jgi:hypothetical protein
LAQSPYRIAVQAHATAVFFSRRVAGGVPPIRPRSQLPCGVTRPQSARFQDESR